MPTLQQRIQGGLLGLLVGDALGVPYEFHHRDEIPALLDIEFDPPRLFRRAHPSVPPGTWSDDGAQALVLLGSLLDCGTIDLEDFAKGLVEWYEDGYMAVGGIVFDTACVAGGIAGIRHGVQAIPKRWRDGLRGEDLYLSQLRKLVQWRCG